MFIVYLEIKTNRIEVVRVEISIINFTGWVGSILFAICAIPQAYKSYCDKHSNGLSILFLLIWFIGEVLTLIYVILLESINLLPLIFNYGCNLFCLLIIMYYRFFPNIFTNDIMDESFNNKNL